jgi:hypothetical protein
MERHTDGVDDSGLGWGRQDPAPWSPYQIRLGVHLHIWDSPSLPSGGSIDVCMTNICVLFSQMQQN